MRIIVLILVLGLTACNIDSKEDRGPDGRKKVVEFVDPSVVNIKAIYYVDETGLKDSTYIEFYFDTPRVLFIANFEHGVLEGRSIGFCKDGTVETIEIYKSGKIIKHRHIVDCNDD